MISDFNDKINSLHELLITDRHVSRLRKAFANNPSAGTKLSKTQLFKIVRSGGFLSELLGRLRKTDFSLIKKCVNQ